jgi:hypothetical protein
MNPVGFKAVKDFWVLVMLHKPTNKYYGLSSTGEGVGPVSKSNALSFARELMRNFKMNTACANLLVLAALAGMKDFNPNSAEAFDFKKLVPGLKSIMHKLGLHVEQGDGLVQILFKSGRHMTRLFLLLMKAYTSKDPAKKQELVDKLKETKVTKEQVLDVLLRLDTLTMHFITGPIRMLDAAMGWHIGVELKKKVQDVGTKIDEAIIVLKEAGHKLKGEKSNLFKKLLSKIRRFVYV